MPKKLTIAGPTSTFKLSTSAFHMQQFPAQPKPAGAPSGPVPETWRRRPELSGFSAGNWNPPHAKLSHKNKFWIHYTCGIPLDLAAVIGSSIEAFSRFILLARLSGSFLLFSGCLNSGLADVFYRTEGSVPDRHPWLAGWWFFKSWLDMKSIEQWI